MFSCEICKIIKRIYFEKHLQMTASGKFYWQILTVILTSNSIKDRISLAVLLVQGFVHGAQRK